MTLRFSQELCEEGRDGYPREVVVCQGGMASMTGDQDLIRRATWKIALRVGQASIVESGVDTYLVVAILKRRQLVMGQAKSPVLLVVRSSIGDPIGPVG